MEKEKLIPAQVLAANRSKATDVIQATKILLNKKNKSFILFNPFISTQKEVNYDANEEGLLFKYSLN